MAEGVLKKETPAQVLVPVRASPVASVDLLNSSLRGSSSLCSYSFCLCVWIYLSHDTHTTTHSHT